MQKGNSALRHSRVVAIRFYRASKNVIYIFLNSPRFICDHVVGENHTSNHRMFAGTIVIIFGVVIAKLGVFMPGGIVVHLATDAVGYLIHGIGAIPFVETVAKGGVKT